MTYLLNLSDDEFKVRVSDAPDEDLVRYLRELQAAHIQSARERDAASTLTDRRYAYATRAATAAARFRVVAKLIDRRRAERALGGV